MTVTHLLLDADDVLQVGTIDFRPALAEVLGENPGEWLRDTFRPDGDVLTGRLAVVPLLAERLRVLGSDHDAQQVYERIWLAIEPDPGMVAQVGRWRAAGLAVHLATNQDSGRAAYMKESLGYAEILDGAYYSSDLGLAKPEAGFFGAILDDLGADPDQVCFIDDMATNVAGARDVGLRAVQWELADGLPALATRMAEVGVRTDGPGTS